MATMELKRVLISDEVDPKCIELFEKNGINAVKKTKLSKEELMKEIQDYDGLIVRSATKVTKDIIDASSRLKIVGRAGTGVDNVDIDAATRKGVIVMNTPGGNTISAAEHTCALICSLARNVAAGDASMKAGRWDRKLFMGHELSGKTLAILGLGQIGKQAALRMQAYGMRTIGYDPFVSKEQAAGFGVEAMSLDEIWPQADYITVHVPLIKATKHLINADVLSRCKPGVHILNVARGGIVDEAALLDKLNAGLVGGAGLDVFETEPPTGISAELAKHPKVIATPHLGASTVEAQTRVAVEIAQQFVDLTNGEALFGAINAGALVSTLDPKCQPWIRLAKSLGALACRTAAPEASLGAAEMRLKVIGCGEGLEKSKYLLNAVLVGVLHAATPNGFNLINAPKFAEEKLIKAEFTHETVVPSNKMADINAAIRLCVEGPGKTWEIVGTTSPAGPLLLSIDGVQFPFGCPLNGTEVLVVKAAPVAIPEMMASIVAKGASVGSFVASSTTEDGSAWAVVNVEGHFDAKTELKHLPFAASVEF